MLCLASTGPNKRRESVINGFECINAVTGVKSDKMEGKSDFEGDGKHIGEEQRKKEEAVVHVAISYTASFFIRRFTVCVVEPREHLL